MRGLIIGYGSAGRRHRDILGRLGISTWTVDPHNPEADYQAIEQALKETWDLAIICSPPDCHLEHIGFLAKAGIEKVLCEKPLCGWDQMHQVKPYPNVRVAYNYRFNHLVASLVPSAEEEWTLFSIKSRDRLPPWGLLLDHVSHDFDILIWKAGLSWIQSVRWIQVGPLRGWLIRGQTNRGAKVDILDLTASVPEFPRAAIIVRGKYAFRIPIRKDMFVATDSNFLSGGDGLPDMKDALRVQELLEEARRKAKAAGVTGSEVDPV